MVYWPWNLTPKKPRTLGMLGPGPAEARGLQGAAAGLAGLTTTFRRGRVRNSCVDKTS